MTIVFKILRYFSNSNNYDIDNGLLLTGSLHDTFDKHYWCIDPINLTVVLNKSKIGNKNLTCCEYENKKIRITPNNKLLHNLQKRYDIFNIDLKYIYLY